MAKKKKKIDFSEINVRSTVTLESIYTVSADPNRSKEEESVLKHNADLYKKKLKKYLDRANNKPLVRESSFSGACIYKGILLRETPKFYVYAEYAHWSDEPIETFPSKRVLKSSVHLEPCPSCSDHPNTYYPRGSER